MILNSLCNVKLQFQLDSFNPLVPKYILGVCQSYEIPLVFHWSVSSGSKLPHEFISQQFLFVDFIIFLQIEVRILFSRRFCLHLQSTRIIQLTSIRQASAWIDMPEFSSVLTVTGGRVADLSDQLLDVNDP